MEELFIAARKASRLSNLPNDETINRVLVDLADRAVEQTSLILSENKKDLDLMHETDPKFDRLKLTEQRIKDIANDLRNVSKLPSPLRMILDDRSLENGLQLQKISVPLGVVGIIYEARPNVTFDVFALCLKSGNVCLLKGGSDANFSNTAIVKVIKDVLRANNVDENLVTLLPADRSATEKLLNAVKHVDVIIPRGSQSLIDFVRSNSKVPVIETGAGIVHTYFHNSGDVAKGASIVYNAKTRRVSVCNALDCLIIDRERLKDLPVLTLKLADRNVTLFADSESYATLENIYPAHLLKKATQEHFGTEFLDYKMSIKTVGGFQEAVDHIEQYSSKHSEAIVAEEQPVIERFLASVDAAAVYANVSTAFTDGAQFGMGAEIGISTQKLHARGPMALPELTSYKWVIRGNGQVRA